MTRVWHGVVAWAVVVAAGLPAGGQAVLIAPGGKQPRVALAPNGTVYVAYGQDNTLYCSTSTDGGRTYSTPAKAGEIDKLMCGMRRGPQIAATGKSVVITAIGKAGNIQCRRSEDGGKTWSDGGSVNDKEGSAREGLHAICAGAKDEVCAVWLDLRDGKTTLFGSLTADGGKRWSKNIPIYESPQGSICECCQPSIASDRKGTYYSMWRNSLDGTRDMWMATSKDGTSFRTPTKLGAGSWRLQQCPMDGGAIAVGQPATVVTAWRRESNVYRCLPGQKEELLGNGRQPQIAAAQDSSVTVWEQNEHVVCARPSDTGPRILGKGRYASVAANADAPASPVIVVWEDDEGVTAATVAASPR